MSRALDIYAVSEHLLGIEESTHILHSIFLTLLEDERIGSVLDIGCGRGGFMTQAGAAGIVCSGIDLSPVMVAAAQDKGLNVTCKNICDVTQKYEAAVAIFDVLNFIPPSELSDFFRCVANTLEEGGIFIVDVNSEYGFSDVAEGSMSAEDETYFLNVNAVYDKERLLSEFTLFERQNDARYVKFQETIVQYYHSLETLRNNGTLTLIEDHPLSLYDVDDKMLLIFKKSS
ncbi:MAG: methyltransferase type 12 [Sulfurimonas sp.]|nr:MAG: methyltransferase type 12 [Sulfurimonas sp.]